MADDVVQGDGVAAAQPRGQAHDGADLRGAVDDLARAAPDLLDADRGVVEADRVAAHVVQGDQLVDRPVLVDDEVRAPGSRAARRRARRGRRCHRRSGTCRRPCSARRSPSGPAGGSCPGRSGGGRRRASRRGAWRRRGSGAGRSRSLGRGRAAVGASDGRHRFGAVGADVEDVEPVPPAALPSAASRSRLALRSASDDLRRARGGRAPRPRRGARRSRSPRRRHGEQRDRDRRRAAHGQKSSPTACWPREARSLLYAPRNRPLACVAASLERGASSKTLAM